MTVNIVAAVLGFLLVNRELCAAQVGTFLLNVGDNLFNRNQTMLSVSFCSYASFEIIGKQFFWLTLPFRSL